MYGKISLMNVSSGNLLCDQRHNGQTVEIYLYFMEPNSKRTVRDLSTRWTKYEPDGECNINSNIGNVYDSRVVCFSWSMYALLLLFIS